MKLTASDINFNEFLAYESLLGSLTPQKQLDSLNGYLLCDTENRLFLLVKDSSSFVEVNVPATVIKDSETSTGIMIDLKMFFYTIRNYSTEQRKSLVIDISTDDNSYFKITAGKDKMSLQHLVVYGSQVEELINLNKDTLPSDFSFDLNLFNDDREDFLRGISNGVKFIASEDDKKNNAFALYKDKLITNTDKHVFVFHYQNPVVFLRGDMPISFHKKAAYILIALNGLGIVYDAKISEDRNHVYFTAKGFVAVLNNSISNINPPEEGRLETLKAPNPLVEIKVSALSETSLFFNGFYKSSQEYKAFTISVEKDGIHFFLKDSGVAGYSTCSVERFLQYDEDVKLVCSLKEPMVATIQNDTLLKFLKELNKEDIVTLYFDNDTEKHPAVHFSNPKKELYIAKMTA